MSLDGINETFLNEDRRHETEGRSHDQAHQEKQIAVSDAVLFGGGTLCAYDTTLTVSHPTLLQQRKTENKSLQPIHIVLSSSGNLNPDIKFFPQPVQPWLLTTTAGANF